MHPLRLASCCGTFNPDIDVAVHLSTSVSLTEHACLLHLLHGLKSKGRATEDVCDMQEKHPKRRRPLPIGLDNGHDMTHCSDRSEASSQADISEEAAGTPLRAWAGAAQRLPNGRSCRLRMDRSSVHMDSDHQQNGEAAARKRLKTTVRFDASLPQATASNAGAQGTNGSGLRSTAEASSSEDSGITEEQADQRAAAERWQRLRQPQSRRAIGGSSGAEGQTVDLRSRLSNLIGIGGMAADTEEAMLKPGRRTAQKGNKSGRGLFGAALTGLQR